MSGRVLLLSENFPPKTGGSGRWFWEIYRRMPRAEVVVLAATDPRQEEFDAGHNVDVVRGSLTMRKWGVRSAAALAGYAGVFAHVIHLVRTRRVSSIHCGRVLPEGWVAWLAKKALRVPYVCYVHGEELALGIVSREYGWMMRRVIAGSEYLIANSENTARLLLDWGQGPNRVVVLHPGVDVERFVPAGRCEKTRQRLGWGGRPVVLTVGRLQRRKGHDMMIRAMAGIRRSVPNVLYSIVGAGEEKGYLEGLVREQGLRGHVEFRGEVSDEEMVACYQHCDLFVLANREINGDIEGFGMALLEAQACGKPVIAGASGGTAETMNIPETGFVVPCDEPEELTRAVTELLLDEARRTRMGEAARQWAVENFSWESLSRQAYELFGQGMRCGGQRGQ